MKSLTFITVLLFINSIVSAGAVEKFTENADIMAVKINGKGFKVHDQNYVRSWNAAPSPAGLPDGTSKPISCPARMVELKNLMITGTLSEGLTIKTVEITAAKKGAKTMLYADRNCTKPLNLTGTLILPGEQVCYIRVLDPDGRSFQVYTLSIMGLNRMNEAQFYKYGAPTFVADSYHTWIWALQNAKPGQIIAVTKTEQYLYKTGEYQIRPVVDNKQNVVVRSFSGNNEDLIIRGHGFHKGSYRDGLPHDELFIVNGANTKNIVVYGITVQESTANGFKLNGYGEENIIFDNCRTINVCERAFKGSGPQQDGKFTRSKNISIINCRFENTMVPVESDHMTDFHGDYIGGIDVMNLSGLTVAGNTFKNIVGKNGGGRGAIFIWGQDGCKDVLIENNRIINCDRGIALGNNSGDPSGNTVGGFYINGGIVRNNFVSESRGEMIEINRLNDVKFYNNTLWRTDKSLRSIRNSGGKTQLSYNLSIINNIICGAVNELPQGVSINIKHNLFSTNDPVNLVPTGEGNRVFDISENFFLNIAHGDFRLHESSVQAFRKGIPLPEVETDFFGTPRGAVPDLGAHQYVK